jgi:hypothetical protein
MTGEESVQSVFEEFPVTWRRVTTDPRDFFADMRQTGGLGEPTAFLAVCAAVSAVGHLLVGWGLRGMIWIFVGQVVGAYLAAAVFVLIAQNLFDGRAGFEPTFRVVAYSAAPLVVFWIPFVGAIAWLYTAFLITRGLEHVQRIDATRAVLTVALGLAALGVIRAVRTGGPAWF